ncbi:MAG: hypothetical protein ACE5JX_19690 [Acidobacteriota bacterium]
MKRWWLRIGILLVIVLALGSLAVWEGMKHAWIRPNQYDIRSEGVLSVGDLAPDIELLSLDGSTPRRLSDFYREKPLVLIFGSYT